MALTNPLHRVFVSLIVLFVAAAPLCAQNVNDGFDPNPDGAVAAMALQADGKILIGGNFSHVGGVSRTLLARLNADGSLDGTFHPVIVGNYIYAMAVQSNGQILIGGQLSQVGTTTVIDLARINSDGSVDSTFNPKAGGTVYAIVVQGDGKILVGGGFTQINGVPSPPLARLNSDGSNDSSFALPDLGNATVATLALQPDNRILIGGALHPTSPTVPVPLMRVLANGSADASFNPSISNTTNNAIIDAMALQPDGRIVFTGYFANVGGYAVKNIGRVDSVGNADALFNSTNSPSIGDGEAVSIVLQPSGDILIGGTFGHINGVARNNVARLTRDGVLGTYNPNVIGPVYALLLQSDSELIIGGFISQIGTTTRHYVGRVDINNYVDKTLALDASGVAYAMASQPSGGVLIGGTFSAIGATTRHHLARLLADGSVDASYDPSPDDNVYAIAQLNDGSALVGGRFQHIGGQARAYLAHLSANGTVDMTFAPIFDGAVAGIVQQPDGKILVYGEDLSYSEGFTHINGATRTTLGRLNADGSLDAPFNVVLDSGYLQSLALQPNGQILIGGVFTLGTHHYIARLNGNSTIDETFTTTIEINGDPIQPHVTGIIVQPDGEILVGGQFLHVNGQAIKSIARLHGNGTLDAGFVPPVLDDPFSVSSLLETTDGKVLIGGWFGVNSAYPNLLRLNHNGTLDATFPDLGVDKSVLALAMARDGKILLSGTFLNVGGIARKYLARLSAPVPPQQSLSVDGNTVTWLRSGAGPELTQIATLLYSVDDSTFAPVGTMASSGSGWRFTGFVPPVGQIYWLRVQAPTTAGANNGSQGIVQYTHDFYLSDDIFKDGFGN